MKVVFLAVVCCLYGARAQDPEVPTVPELDLTKYEGRWYQTYGNAATYSWFLENGVCITATYGIMNATQVSVYNHMRLFTPDGVVDELDGVAYATEEPGKFEVELDGVPFGAPYWVVKLGPLAEYDGVEQYSYAVVTDNLLFTLFVLARDVTEFEEKYEEDVMQWVVEFGFDSELNEPIKTFHSDACIYPWS